VLTNYGEDRRPFGVEGPIVRAVAVEKVWGEYHQPKHFTEEEDRKGFKRTMATLQEEDLIGVGESDGVTLIWLASSVVRSSLG